MVWCTDVAGRGTVGVGEIMDALSDPTKAKNFAARIKKLITDAKGNERVGLHCYTLL